MLAAFDYRAFYDREGRQFCCLCGAFDGHDPRCWSLHIPRIVAALEPAARIVADMPTRGGSGGRCYYCLGGGKRDSPHAEDCPWWALATAMELP